MLFRMLLLSLRFCDAFSNAAFRPIRFCDAFSNAASQPKVGFLGVFFSNAAALFLHLKPCTECLY